MDRARFEGTDLQKTRAALALPILVQHAHAGRPIYYSELAAELGIHQRVVGKVLGCIGHSLLRLPIPGEIPPIQALVVNKASETPGPGFAEFAGRYGEDYRHGGITVRRAIIDRIQSEVIAFSRWNEVLDSFGLAHLAPLTPSIDPRLGPPRYGGTGESPAHKALKMWVATHPEVVGLKRNGPRGEEEYQFLSEDRADVRFDLGLEWVLVEVKTADVLEPEITKGLYQCVKYEALARAEQVSRGLHPNARAVLVLGGSLPSEVRALRKCLGVDVVEGVFPA
jgi:hypothetical protein